MSQYTVSCTASCYRRERGSSTCPREHCRWRWRRRLLPLHLFEGERLTFIQSHWHTGKQESRQPGMLAGLRLLPFCPFCSLIPLPYSTSSTHPPYFPDLHPSLFQSYLPRRESHPFPALLPSSLCSLNRLLFPSSIFPIYPSSVFPIFPPFSFPTFPPPPSLPPSLVPGVQVVDVGFQSGGQILHGGGIPIKVTCEPAREWKLTSVFISFS